MAAPALREPTPSQTIGPFPHEAWRWAFQGNGPSSPAAAVVDGVVYDGAGQPVDDAILEARTAGLRSGVPGIAGFQRIATDGQGRFSFTLAALPAPGEPALVLTVFARGLLEQQFTAVWLDDAGASTEPAARGGAVVGAVVGVVTSALTGALAQLPATRRGTLLARPVPAAEAGGPRRYAWDLHLQGPDETVFFAFR